MGADWGPLGLEEVIQRGSSAAALFADLGYGQMWTRMCAGLGPLKALFELLAGSAPTLALSATHHASLLVVAIDGTVPPPAGHCDLWHFRISRRISRL